MTGVSCASPRNPGRPESANTIRLRGALIEILRAGHPMSVRGAFYAASVAGAVPKTEAGYRKVQTLLVRMRERQMIPWSWIADGTRWRRGADTFDGIEEALRWTAQLYRRSLWESSSERVEVWLEKEALAGVIVPITAAWTVDLMVCRGYPSLSFLHSAAEDANRAERKLVIYYLGDLDPSGKDIPRTIRDRLTAFGVDFDLVELAVTRDQVSRWGLPSRPTKQTDTRTRGFEGDSVELDAIPADVLRGLVNGAIEGHLDPDEVDRLDVIEAEERAGIVALAEGRK